MVLNNKNFEFAKFKFNFQQMDMVYPVTSCLMAIVALTFGIYSIKSMYDVPCISSIMGLRFSGRWDQSLLYIWLVNMDLNYYLVIFVFLPCFVFFVFFQSTSSVG